MKILCPSIHYHTTEPIYSCDIQLKSDDNVLRLATAGGDDMVRLWNIYTKYSDIKDNIPVTFLSTLKGHLRRVNVVRWSSNGRKLASGSDDAVIMIWTKSDENPIKNENEDENIETWKGKPLIRHIQDVYDLSWSPCNNKLVSASVDCHCFVWNLKHPKRGMVYNDHKQYVQGVKWDPLDEYIITQSNDRTFRVYNPNRSGCLFKVGIINNQKLFHDSQWNFFFRRPDFSPDGRILVTPAGIYDRLANGEHSYGEVITHAAHMFTRIDISKVAVTLITGSNPVLGVRFNPLRFDLKTTPAKSLFRLPYRYVFCLILEKGILLYDTEHDRPFGKFMDMHSTTINDATWSPNGRCLTVCSTDGYCTYIYFEEGELGDIFKYDLPLYQKPNEQREQLDADESSMNKSDMEQTELHRIREQTTQILVDKSDMKVTSKLNEELTQADQKICDKSAICNNENEDVIMENDECMEIQVNKGAEVVNENKRKLLDNNDNNTTTANKKRRIEFITID